MWQLKASYGLGTKPEIKKIWVTTKAEAWVEIKCNLTYSPSAGKVGPNNVAKVTHLGEDIQTFNTYYEGILSNYEANYASNC